MLGAFDCAGGFCGEARAEQGSGVTEGVGWDLGVGLNCCGDGCAKIFGFVDDVYEIGRLILSVAEIFLVGNSEKVEVLFSATAARLELVCCFGIPLSP